MNVEVAIELMAKNPAVGFPWKDDLVTLVNSFLPGASQLDPHTAEAVDIRAAVGSLDASMIQMLYASSINSYGSLTPAPVTVRECTHSDPQELVRTILYGMIAMTVCLLSVVLSFRVTTDEGVASLVDLLKHVITAVISNTSQ